MPGRAIVLHTEFYDPATIRYAMSWRHPPGALVGLPNLQAIFSLGAGVDHLFADPNLPDRPILRVVDPDLRDRMSEWIVMHALMHLRQLKRYESQQRARLWLDDDDQPAAADIRVGILGLGVLGLDAARKLLAMGFRVAGWSATEKTAPGVDAFVGPEGLDALLARTDILVTLLPLTPQTRGILDAALLAKLRKRGRLGGPVLINAGRGGLQIEADVLAALDSGVLAGASLDVFETEPLPRLPGYGAIRRSSSARITPRCRRPKPSRRQSCGRSRPMKGASTCKGRSIGHGAIERRRLEWPDKPCHNTTVKSFTP